MKTINVNLPSNSYDVLLGNGAFLNAAKSISSVFEGEKVYIITDNNVAPLYLNSLKDRLLKEGHKVFYKIIQAGEQSKTVNTLVDIYESFLDNGINRSSLIIGLGGGVIGDIAGFCAATLLRGISHALIPTTLLAQGDSCIGGKTGVNLKRGKNLVGAFYQPKLVIIDPLLLQTLKKETFMEGCAEIIKHGAIGDESLFINMEKGQDYFKENIESILFDNCAVKIGCIINDELDKGQRMMLNFGHTIGHAIESHYGYMGYSHGLAVSAGMALECKIGEKMGVTNKGTANRLKMALELYGLNISADNITSKVLQSVSYDKKNNDDYIYLPMLQRIGKGIIKKIPREEMLFDL